MIVEPEGEENIGYIARLMANFGQGRLVLVNPKCDITGRARSRAMHGWSVLKAAKRAKSLKEAITGFDFVVGATAKAIKDSSTTRAYMTPRELAEAAKKVDGRLCLVLGRESTGLTNSELHQCDLVVHIQADEGYSTLNIAHAAAIVLYELFSAKGNQRRVADVGEKEAIISLFGEVARAPGMGRRKPDNAVKMFRNVISRAFISGREAHGIAGVLKKCRDKLYK